MKDRRRLNPFARLPQEPVDTMRVAKPVERKRAWDKAHRPASYKIPLELRGRALLIRQSIRAIADERGYLVDHVATVFTSYGLHCVEAGSLALLPRPAWNAGRRKMALTWTEQQAWPRDIPQPKPKKSKTAGAPGPTLLSYRWSDETVRDAIKEKALAHNLPAGELLLSLLDHALAQWQAGAFDVEPGDVQGRRALHGWVPR